MESFIFFGLFVFFLHMYNSNTKSLIIVGAHLMKNKNKRYYVQFVSLIDLIRSL